MLILHRPFLRRLAIHHFKNMEKLLILFVLMLPQNSFKETQLKNVRVKTAFTEKEETVKGLFQRQKR